MTASIPTQSMMPQEFLGEILEGFSQDQKVTSPRWLYDMEGSRLFEEITQLPEYYPTRTERGILRQCCPQFATRIGPQASIVEYGAGAAVKTRILLDALEEPREYVALDISFDHLQEALKPLAQDYPDVDVRPLEGDFLSLERSSALNSDGQKVGFFPGSTIGNLNDEEVSNFLSGVKEQLGEGAYLILGADLKKDLSVLIPAYDDASGVTASFNLNLLERINRELGATIDPDRFAHRAVWNDDKSQIEMHLEALEDHSFEVAGQPFLMSRGETIHTENSRKFDRPMLEGLLEPNGWAIEQFAHDENAFFSVMLARAN